MAFGTLPTLEFINKPTIDQLMLVSDLDNFDMVKDKLYTGSTINLQSFSQFLDSGRIIVFLYDKDAQPNKLKYGAPVFVCQDNASGEASMSISNIGDINGYIEEFIKDDLVTINLGANKKTICSCYRSMRHLVDTLDSLRFIDNK